MSNLKIAAGIFAALLIATFTFMAAFLEKFNLPLGSFLEELKDKVSSIFHKEGKGGEISFSLKIKPTELSIATSNPSNIESLSLKTQINFGDTEFSLANKSIKIFDFKGDVKYHSRGLEVKGSCNKVIMDGIETTKEVRSFFMNQKGVKKLYLSNLTLDELEILNPSGELSLEDMKIEISGKKVKMFSFNGQIKVGEEIEISGLCSKILVGSKTIQ